MKNIAKKCEEKKFEKKQKISEKKLKHFVRKKIKKFCEKNF